jgi:hypothetical protein
MKINLIEYGGKHYVFYNTLNEKEHVFIDRTWFIVKNIKKISDYKYLESLSHLWVNIKFLQTVYDANIMDILNSCESVYETI